MAGEATPEAAMQIIGMLEQLQAELDEKLKALPPQEKKVAEGPIDALRPRLVALSHAVAPAAEAKPATSERRPPKDAPAPVRTGAKVEVEWHGPWYAAEILRVSGGSSLIHSTGFDSSWDEWVAPGRIRSASAASTASARPQPPTRPDFAAVQQAAREPYLRPRPQIMRRR